jgi:hypothetical protein
LVKFKENLANTPLDIQENMNHQLEIELTVELTETIQFIIEISSTRKTIKVDPNKFLKLHRDRLKNKNQKTTQKRISKNKKRVPQKRS